MNNIFAREIALLGEETFRKLNRKHVCVLGIGGVGSYVCEALVRGGIGHLTVVDSDTVDETNINRQLIATTKTVGLKKADLMASRAREINPDIDIAPVVAYIGSDNVSEIIKDEIDFVADCIDSVTSKLSVIEYCHRKGFGIISAMGAGNRLVGNFSVCDISKTHTDPLSRVMRRELKVRGITRHTVVFSPEVPSKIVFEGNGRHAPASISYPPALCGLTLAGEIIRQLIVSE